MHLTWLGHSGFRLEIEDQVLLIDPWFTGNPVFPQDRRGAAIAGATGVLITHGHGDHSADAVAVSRETGAPVVGTYDLTRYWEDHERIATIGFNKGGTVRLGNVAVTLVAASHSSALWVDGKPLYAGTEAGFMIAGEGRVVYVSGDTDVMADMEWMGQLHRPDVGLLACGGHFTMDMTRAAWAARRYFDFKTVVPSHYGTFGLLAQDARALIDGLPGVRVLTPQVMERIAV
jgi:L-ascorbate metabolism protein UlaG (beta-lactamase superfamily)